MKRSTGMACAAAGLLLSSGCVQRTVMRQTENRGPTSEQKQFGDNPHDRVVDTQTIWFWQKEFREKK